MLSSYGVISLLALATASTASPISAARRDSSLVPTPPPACLAIASNSTAVSASNTTNITDTSSLSNVTGGANTTTTCIVPASDLPTSLNGTDLSNVTSISNCTSLTNSTSTDTTGSSDNSTTTLSSTATATATSSADTSTDTSSADTSTDTGSTDNTSTDTSSTDTAPPPASTAPPSDSSSGGDGSSGTPDPTSGQFTADTGDPAGRRKRSSLAALFHSLRPRLHRITLSPHHRRIAQTDLPTIAQNWQDLCLASGGDIFTNDPCVNLAGIAGINALLSTGGACDQQDNADNMINFAKSPGVTNEDALIAAAIAYRQHPRNADDIGGDIVPSTPYCTKQPRNQELVGIVNEQLPGVNPGLFGGPNSPIVAFGADGTCPAGQSPDVSTCSCA